jgi:hypothetical protein
MKELISRELLYFFVALFVSIPTGMLFVYLMRLKPVEVLITEDESVLEMDYFIIGAVLGFIGVYLIRAIMWAVKNVLLSN